mmetsp:Transcript_3235/g.6958  ORF Transcript_3235/g.6958 Transcript_3235/m.6958 type:complete len:236 (+) Transcript_3235:2-709(+)
MIPVSLCYSLYDSMVCFRGVGGSRHGTAPWLVFYMSKTRFFVGDGVPAAAVATVPGSSNRAPERAAESPCSSSLLLLLLLPVSPCAAAADDDKPTTIRSSFSFQIRSISFFFRSASSSPSSPMPSSSFERRAATRASSPTNGKDSDEPVSAADSGVAPACQNQGDRPEAAAGASRLLLSPFVAAVASDTTPRENSSPASFRKRARSSAFLSASRPTRSSSSRLAFICRCNRWARR